MSSTTHHFLCRELQRLDILVHREILRLRARYQLSLDEFRGLYISDEQVDGLINQTVGVHAPLPAIQHLTDQARQLRIANSEHMTEASQWTHMIQEFNLNPFEQDVVLLALAPEVDLKYETLYGYLNNDVTRKYPTVDLALRVCGEEGAGEFNRSRSSLNEQSLLFEQGLLEHKENPARGAGTFLAQGFFISPLLANYLLGIAVNDPDGVKCVSLQSITDFTWESISHNPDIIERLKRWTDLVVTSKIPQLLVMEGYSGAGRGTAARAISARLGRSVIEVDLSSLTQDPLLLNKRLRQIILQARLQRGLIHLQHGEILFKQEGPTQGTLPMALIALNHPEVPICMNVLPDTSWRERLPRSPCVSVKFPTPTAIERLELWERSIGSTQMGRDRMVVKELAQRFPLNQGQIENAVATAHIEQQLNEKGQMTFQKENLYQAARNQAVGDIGKLAQKIPPKFWWDDLILPEAIFSRVKEIAGAVQTWNRVYHEWGMAKRVRNANGLMVLFAGPSGTGKTMTASVIANDLGLDLYRIDLAGVVSKYIGETEKNLDRIFAAAHQANGILFFDEADALFGKRSEVKDAHDRYANIETAYLLQKMEEHEGLVILATNLSKNMDQAFSRRMHYVIEFPKPDATQRERMWRAIFPPEVPLGKDVDFGFLGRQFLLTGGDIKNVALDAAFLAAQNGQILNMQTLIQAMARQMLKQGKVPSATDFKQYHSMIGSQN